ncbi:MAG: RNA polymerase subunit sigma [Flavobacteriaceae bacterium]|nr:RNA polymerase subunit sigma [Flavobacteriaceae bacterium]
MSLTNQNIESLLVLCNKGNQLAQLEVYNRYQGAMYNTALRIVRDTAEAEDIMQEAFLTAFQKLDSFKGTATFGAWLKRIVINKSLEAHKKSKRFVPLAETLLPEDCEETIEDELQTEFVPKRATQVMDCMLQLHSSYSQILTLHLVEGYDYEELCEVLNISYANCRTLISRAKQSLRKQLTQAS